MVVNKVFNGYYVNNNKTVLKKFESVKKLIGKSKQDCVMEWKKLYLYKNSLDYFEKIGMA